MMRNASSLSTKVVKISMQRFSAKASRWSGQVLLWTGMLLAAGLTGPTASAQPVNDNFADAIELTGSFGSVTGTTVDATGEPGEPNHVGFSSGNSIWYVWTAPTDGVVSFHTFGSSFDTLLAVYAGTALNALQSIAGNDDFDPNIIGPSGVKFLARAGQTYYIAVDGFFGDTGETVLTYSYSGAGIFQFTSEVYAGTELESSSPNQDVPLSRSSLLGIRLTVTRLFGSSGRVLVDYATSDGSAVAGVDYFPRTGTLTFNDHEMSKSFLVPVLYNFASIEDTDFSVTLSNPRLAPTESTDIIPPTLNPDLTTATVVIYNVDADPDPEIEEALFSFQRSNYRVREDEVAVGGTFDVTMYVYRTGIGDALDINYKILTSPLTPGGDNRRNNQFELNAGSDYATPLPLDALPYGRSADFYGNVGTLSWGQNNFDPQPITITITNDNLVEFNEDILVQLVFQPTQDEKRRLGSARLATLTILHDDLPAGSVDPSHNPDFNLGTIPPNNPNPGANGVVYATAVQPSGGTVIAGAFTAVNTIPRNRIARLNANGSHDGTFDPGTGANGFISAIALENGGRIVIGGGFTSFNGAQRNGIARLNANGGLDGTFTPGLGANGAVWAVAIQTDGKIVIGGEFTTVGGIARNGIARLNADGSLDEEFDPGAGADGSVNAIVIQSDGALVIGGEFGTVGGLARSGVARLHSDGAVDAGFDPGAGADGAVYALALQGANQVLVGGAFANMDLRSYRGLARLNPDGSLDSSFNIGSGANDTVYAIRVQNDGLILVGGIFTSFNQTRRVGLTRLHSYGTVDTTFLDTAYNNFAGFINLFASDPKNFIFSISLDANNDVLVGGGFKRIGGGRWDSRIQPEGHDLGIYTRGAYRVRNNIARLLGGGTPGPGAIELAYDSYQIDENSSQLYVSIVRTNGSLGPASANFNVAQLPPGPGAATNGLDYAANGASPTFVTSWPSTRMRSDGLFGPNFGTSTVIPDLLMNDVRDDVYVDIFDNTIPDGNRTAMLELSAPSSLDILFLGGENIPVGAALGRASAPMVIVDNDTQPGVLGFSAPAYFVNENGTNALITVTRTNGSSGNVTVQFQTSNGTAIAGSDYSSTNGTLTFLNGQTERSFLVRITDDSAVEPDETINLTLLNPSGGASIGLANAILTIIDNDLPGGKVSFTSATYSTNESAVSAIISVSRAGSSAGTLTVYASATSGTAISGIDFLGVTNLLTWSDGDTGIKTFVVPLLDDAEIEPDVTVMLQLYSPTLNTVTNPLSLGAISNATLTIVNDDLLGAVSFSTSTYLANEHGGPVTVTVVRTGGSAGSIAVNFAAAAGTASNGVDFLATNGTLSFGPGVVSRSFNVAIINNEVTDNPDRTIALSLFGASPGGGLGSPANAVINIVDDESVNEPPGGIDTNFDLLGANDSILSLVQQADGKIIAGGDFTAVNGLSRNRIARFTANGQLDLTFSTTTAAAGANAAIRTVALQDDGRVLLGGEFSMVGGAPRGGLARLNFNGSLDAGFDPGSGTDGPVFAVAESYVIGARKIWLGGGFSSFDGNPRNAVARINDDGTLDVAFDPGAGPDGVVYAVVAYPTNSTHGGKLLIGGNFTSYAGVSRAGVARINSDGSLDLSFNPGTGALGTVRAIALQPDGRILLGGSFTNFNGVALNRLARLNDAGSLDNSFNAGVGANDTVLSLQLQGDTKIVVGGLFTRCNGVSRNRLTRLNNDGSVDPTINFGLGANSFVAATMVQADGKIVIGGGFTEYDGVPRQRIARIYGGSIAGSGTLEFASPSYQVSEGGTNATITVRRYGGTAGATPGGSVSVNAMTSDGTATNGIHYIGGTNTLVFAAGEVFQSFTIPVIDNFEINPARTVNLTLGNILPPGSATIGNQPTATLTILDDDTGISFSSATYTRNENSPDGQATITIVRTGSTAAPATVNFTTTTNGTATAGWISYR
jgi:uncharacterized delta-60 repeat protein